jgi:copper oxidase (laccase) domain-containing protein
VLADHEIRETFSPFCTLCHRHLFFSYRGGDATERLYSGIMKPSRQ